MNKDAHLEKIFNDWKRERVVAGQLSVRAALRNGWSYKSAGNVKWIIKNYADFNWEAVISGDSTFKTYHVKIKELIEKGKTKITAKKTKQQNTLRLADFEKTIKIMQKEIEPSIKTGVEQYATRLNDRYNFLQRKKKSLPRSEERAFLKKLDSEGMMLWSRPGNNSDSAYLMRQVKDFEKRFRMGEHNKINSLFVRLLGKYPHATDIQYTKHRLSGGSHEFTMTLVTPEETFSVFTTTIVAGGYNIQKLHLRWLMKVLNSRGKLVTKLT